MEIKKQETKFLKMGQQNSANSRDFQQNQEIEQAGAELYQAQDKLGLASPALPIKKLRSSSN